MSQVDHLIPNDHIKDGFLFPNITKVKMMNRRTGETRIKTIDDMQKSVSAKLYSEIYSELNFWGEYKNAAFHIMVEEQSVYS